MNLLHIFLGFFIANILGYGGGPSTIPLMQAEIVNHYHWLNNTQFADVLAVANALPGPIASKIAAAVGFQVAGLGGLFIALAAAVIPSAVGIVLLLRLFNRFRTSDVIKGITILVQPVIAVLMVILTWNILQDSVQGAGWIQSVLIGVVALLAIRWWKVHPALVVAAAFVYGGIAALVI